MSSCCRRGSERRAMRPIPWETLSSSCLETGFSRSGRAIASLRRKPSGWNGCPTRAPPARAFEIFALPLQRVRSNGLVGGYCLLSASLENVSDSVHRVQAGVRPLRYPMRRNLPTTLATITPAQQQACLGYLRAFCKQSLAPYIATCVSTRTYEVAAPRAADGLADRGCRVGQLRPAVFFSRSGDAGQPRRRLSNNRSLRLPTPCAAEKWIIQDRLS